MIPQPLAKKAKTDARRPKGRVGDIFAMIFPVAAFALVIAASGCGRQKERPPVTDLVRIAAEELPEPVDDLNYTGLAAALTQNIEYLKNRPADRIYQIGPDRYTVSHLRRSHRIFREFVQTRPSSLKMRTFLQHHFIVYQSVGRDGRGEVLFTGYFEPELLGRRSKTPVYRYPVYARPADLAAVDLSAFSDKFAGEKILGRCAGGTFIPYHDRSEIMAENVLSSKASVLAYVADRVGLFFLHVAVRRGE